jgi:hypothetical protein
MKPRAWLLPELLLCFGLFALYGATACRTVGPGDSGELTAAMCRWGVAHAPGFPLLVLIGNLVSHVVPLGEPAFALNLMNAAFAAIACAVLTGAVSLVTGSRLAGLVAGLALGTSRIFWHQALALEVFSLNALMAALLLCLLCRFLAGERDSAPAFWTLPLAVLVASTVVTHHTTLVLLAAPALVIHSLLVWRATRAQEQNGTRARIALQCALAAALGLLPLLYLPFAARLDPPVNWGDARGLGDVWRLLSRQDFGSGTLLSPSIVAGQVLRYGESASPLGQRNLLAFLAEIPRGFGWAFPALALLGVVWLARRSRPLLVLAIAFGALVLLFFTRVNTPIVPVYVAITERLFVLPHVVLAWLAGCGVAQLAVWAGRALIPAAAVVVAAIGATALPMGFVNAPLVEQRSNTFTRDFGANVLAGMPHDAVYFSTGDLFRGSMLYQQFGLARRADITVVDLDLLHTAWYFRQLQRRGDPPTPTASAPESNDPGSIPSRRWLELLLAYSADRPARPVTALRFSDRSFEDDYRLLPMSIWSRVIPRDSGVDPTAWASESADVVRQWDVRSLDHTYPEASWESAQQVFYSFALGQMRGLIEMSARVAPEAALPAVPALAIANGWSGSRRAELLAYEAEFLRERVSDRVVPLATGEHEWLLARSMSLADSALALDGENVQALQTRAALLTDDSRLRDPLRELQIRSRLVRLRPGDFSELVPYLRLALRLTKDPAHGDPSFAREAEAARARLLNLLEICARISPDPQWPRLRQEWSQPLELIPALRAAPTR